MSYNLVVRPEARVDMIEAATWYEQQQPRLGGEFALATQNAIDSLANNALVYRVRVRYRRHEVRWLFPERFPYRAIYFVDGPTVTVIAVLHAKRDDREWKRRV